MLYLSESYAALQMHHNDCEASVQRGGGLINLDVETVARNA